jgi:hypothetical protein
VTFSRRSSIPYFVVFTTTPRSVTLAREIASDATVSVSVIRQVTIREPVVLPSPPITPTSSGDELDGSALPRGTGGFLRRVVRKKTSSTLRSLRSSGDSSSDHGHGSLAISPNFDLKEKPLPQLPLQTVWTNSQTLHTAMCLGFPKRPRSGSDPARKHPTLEEQAALPDGLHKSKILLNRFMVPSVSWAGLNVKVRRYP